MIPATLIATVNAPGAALLPAAAPPASPMGQPTAFGRELQRASEHSADEADPAPPASQAAAAGGPSPADQARIERQPATPADGRHSAEAPGPAKAAKPGRTESADGEAEDTIAPDDEREASAGAAVAPPIDLSAFVASLGAHRPVAPREPAAAAITHRAVHAGEDKNATEPRGVALGAEPAATASPGEALRAPLADRLRVAQQAHAEHGPGAASASTPGDAANTFQAMVTEAAASASAGRSHDAGPSDALTAASSTSGPARSEPAVTTVTAAPAVVEDSLAPRVDSREFAQALGARVAVFARDGVEHARLNIHPAEMGPIALQLALEGTQLRVDMSADMAATRQALEQALPGLASALSEAGLTLSGGGVFQQARDGAGDPGPRGPASNGRGRADEAVETGEPTLLTRPVRLDGLVDLYA